MTTCECTETSHNHKNPCGKEVKEGNLCAYCKKEKDKTGDMFHKTSQTGNPDQTRKP
jgi:hypothetical protein